MRFLPAAALLWGLSLGCTSAASALKEADFALIHACATGDLQTARMLVSQGADVNARTPVQGGTALMLAAMKGKLKLVELLLANGAEVNASSPEGNTAYSFAESYGHAEITKLLLAHGATMPKPVIPIKAHAQVVEAPAQAGHSSAKDTKKSGSPPVHEVPEIDASVQQDFTSGEEAIKHGNGVEAARFYLKAAEQGHATAQYRLGILYENGQGVAPDADRSVYWIRKAAERGEVQAQFSLAVMYDIGRNISQDYPQALYWYVKAAERGNVQAQNNLGFMYSEGKGMTQDYVRAYKWFNIAGLRGYEEGRKNRDYVAKFLLPAQLSEAQQQTEEWLKAHP